jgi:hypothetical protein
MRPHSLLCAALTAGALLSGVALSPARAAADPRLTPSVTSIPAGSDLVVSGNGWPFDVDVHLEITAPGARAVNAPVDRGSFNATLGVPPGTPPGVYQLFACQSCDPIDGNGAAAQADVNVIAPSVTLDPPSASAGDLLTASGSGWSTGRDVYLFSAQSPTCDPSSALATATPDGLFAFSVSTTVPSVQPRSYEFMAAQCEGSKVIASAVAPFTITATVPPSTVTTTSPRVSTTPPTLTSTPATGTTTPPTLTSTPPTTSTPAGSGTLGPVGKPSPRFGQFVWLALALVAAALAVIATQFLVRRPRHGGRPTEAHARLAYEPAPAPAVEETSPTTRHDIRMLTEERYVPDLNTEERR